MTKMKVASIMYVCAVCVWGSVVHAGDSVLLTSTAAEREQNLDSKIQEYIQQAVQQSYLRKVGELVQDKVVQHRVGMPGSFVMVAVNQAAVGAFEQEAIQDVIRNTYRETFEFAKEARGDPNVSNVPQQIERRIEDNLSEIYAMPVFDRVIEVAIEGALRQYRQIVTQYAVQQQIQKAIIQQRIMQEILQKQLLQLYQQALVSQLQQ